MLSIASIRKDYQQKTLSEHEVAADPIDQFTIWWQEALHAKIDEVNAMTLSTVTSDGLPSARIVLLKGYDKNGFVFFTNYESAKGREMAANPRACLLFFWKEVERQVRINGTVEKVSEAESDAYFNSRPEGSRLGAWVSPQSRVIESRDWLEENEKKMRQKFNTEPVYRPANWGGYRVMPVSVEFWQGRTNRLHDRILYTLNKDSNWTIERLAP